VSWSCDAEALDSRRKTGSTGSLTTIKCKSMSTTAAMSISIPITPQSHLDKSMCYMV